MEKWIAVVLTVAALSIGGWAVVRWWETQPPDEGQIALASITPPSTERIDLGPQTWCDKAVSGYRMYGTSKLDEPMLWDWYDERFGKVLEEPTARLNRQPGLTGSIRVYDDIQVRVRGHDLMVYTYNTVSHECVPQDAEPWDLRNAYYSPRFLCDFETNLVFWSVSYGKAEPEPPPSDWATIGFDGGRRIAHGLSDLDVIYAQESPSDPWHRYVRAAECGID